MPRFCLIVAAFLCAAGPLHAQRPDSLSEEVRKYVAVDTSVVAPVLAQPLEVPPLDDDTVRIIPLGGVEEIGRNMTAVEVGNDIFILDCGFAFSEDDTPGIDYILPNTGYLEERRDKIRGLLISHGHLDHIGGIPYIIDRIGYMI